MDLKYYIFIMFLIGGILAIIRGVTYVPPKGNEELPDITKLTYYLGGSLMLLFTLLILRYA